ncbi:MAG TPA: glycosyltransferase family 25 protein [Burkholderiales bacterium]|nr:glycosyltransferase family 25 protein [Burkholderiales bacterium]
MAGEAPRPVNQWVDAVYVLTVATFAERIAHIRRELARHAIGFELVLAHDVGALDPSSIGVRFAGSALAPAQRSLALKHAQAWRNAVERGQRRILVFEDDAVLARDFVPRFDAAMRAAERLAPGWLVFLGGADTKVPDSYFLARGPLVALPIATAEGYVTDLEAARRRLAWLAENEIALPADHLIKHADAALGVAQYWLRPPIVEQGSVLGMFDSLLDAHRRKHSRAFNILRNRWNKFQRHRLRGWLVRARIMLKFK